MNFYSDTFTEWILCPTTSVNFASPNLPQVIQRNTAQYLLNNYANINKFFARCSFKSNQTSSKKINSLRNENLLLRKIKQNTKNHSQLNRILNLWSKPQVFYLLFMLTHPSAHLGEKRFNFRIVLCLSILTAEFLVVAIWGIVIHYSS